MEAFRLIQGGKLIIAVPHAGNQVPPELEGRLHASYNPEGHDQHAREIYSCLSEHGTILLGTPNRELIDYNRARDNLHPSEGVLPLIGANGNGTVASIHSSIEREVLLSYWDTFHSELDRLASEQKDKYGKTVILAGHTMETIGPKLAKDKDKLRPAVCIGTLEGKLAGPEYIDAAYQGFKDSGLWVSIDKPFKGAGYLTLKHGKPEEGSHIVQVEVSYLAYRTDKDKVNKAVGSAAKNLAGLL
jgi:N-formylglutamate deformylase